MLLRPQLDLQLLVVETQSVLLTKVVKLKNEEGMRRKVQSFLNKNAQSGPAALKKRRTPQRSLIERTDMLTGRFGLGEGSEGAVRALKVPLKAQGGLFAAVCLRGADTLINYATEPRMQARLPGQGLGERWAGVEGGDPGTIEDERDALAVERHVHEDLVKGAIEEAGIQRNDGMEPGAGQACG